MVHPNGEGFVQNRTASLDLASNSAHTFVMPMLNRAHPGSVALETTLLVHGVPKDTAHTLAGQLAQEVRAGGSHPALVGVVHGQPIVGMTDAELTTLLDAAHVQKVNAANLGIAMHRGVHGATTVSTTIELASKAGIRFMATGGLGGVHRGYAQKLDISSDLAAISRYPVAVVTSGVKSLLDVAATRELFETLGIPVVGYRTDSFPAFYVRNTDIPLDARFDDPDDLARYIVSELARTGRGIVVANPCPESHALAPNAWQKLLDSALKATQHTTGRDITPAILAHTHARSHGQTLDANIALARSNAALAGELCAHTTRG